MRNSSNNTSRYLFKVCRAAPGGLESYCSLVSITLLRWIKVIDLKNYLQYRRGGAYTVTLSTLAPRRSVIINSAH